MCLSLENGPTCQSVHQVSVVQHKRVGCVLSLFPRSVSTLIWKTLPYLESPSRWTMSS